MTQLQYQWDITFLWISGVFAWITAIVLGSHYSTKRWTKNKEGLTNRQKLCYIILVIVVSILVILFIQTSKDAYAEENWVHYGTTSDGGKFSYSKGSIKNHGHFIEVLTKSENGNEESLWCICTIDKTFSIVATIDLKTYRVHYGSGLGWYIIPSGSLMDTLYQILLENRKMEDKGIPGVDYPKENDKEKFKEKLTPIPNLELTGAIQY